MVHFGIAIILVILWRIAFHNPSQPNDEDLLGAQFSWRLAIRAMAINTGISFIFLVYIVYRTGDITPLSIMRSEYIAIQTFTTIGYGNYEGLVPKDYHVVDYLMHNLVMLSTSIAWAVVVSSLTACVIAVGRFKSRK